MTESDHNSTEDSLKESIRRDIHDRIQDGIRVRGRSSCCSGYQGIIWGGAILAVGVILLLDHLGVVSADHLWRFWPMLLIIGGASSLAEPGRRAWGILLIVVGVLFQLDTLRVIRFSWADLWPIVIIAVGLMMIWSAIETRRRSAILGSTVGPSTMNATAIFGGVERRITSGSFTRGTVNAIFGGGEIDFHGADMEGDQAILEVNAIFGGAEVRVPENWTVEFRGQTLFGGYSDTTRTGVARNADGTTKRKTLILTGTILFGGVEVKN
jgi:predicted membrane protein